MSGPLLYVTGTNTGVGKTTLAALLLERARQRNFIVGVSKLFCTGGRGDAEKLHSLQTAGMSLDEVNPFRFDEPLTPLLAARRSGKRVTLEETFAKIPIVDFPLLVEGAGGLLSPLGEDFSILNLIQKRPGRICIVGPDQLGVLNHILLTAALLGGIEFSIVLMEPEERDTSTGTNAELLKELIPRKLILTFANLNRQPASAKLLDELLEWWMKPGVI